MIHYLGDYRINLVSRDSFCEWRGLCTRCGFKVKCAGNLDEILGREDAERQIRGELGRHVCDPTIRLDPWLLGLI